VTWANDHDGSFRGDGRGTQLARAGAPSIRPPARTTRMSARMLTLKTISTLRPHFFDPGAGARGTGHAHGYDVTGVDLGHLYWRRTFDRGVLAAQLDAEPVDEAAPGEQLQREIDQQAVRDLPAACAILGEVAQRMPSAAELLFCFR